MRSVIYETIEHSNLDPLIKQEALIELTNLEEDGLVDMDSANINLAFLWDDSELGSDFWAEIASELDYADLEYRSDESIEF